jgi:hypothetical protein
LNSAENRLRVLMVIRPPYRRIHLTGLSQEAGTPLRARMNGDGQYEHQTTNLGVRSSNLFGRASKTLIQQIIF